MTQQPLHVTSGDHYPKIEVIQQGSVRYLRFGPRGGWQGGLDTMRPNRPIFPYQRAFSTLTRSLPARARFMSLGVGTGTALRTVRAESADCELYGVEIEQAVVDTAIRFFESPSHTEANYWIGDGVAFLCHVDLTFDLIFVDAFSANQIHTPCLDPAFATVLAAALTNEGVAVCNVISHVPLRGRAQKFLEAAQKLFPVTAVLPVGNPLVDQNMLMVFAKQPSALAEWRRTIRAAADIPAWERATWPLRLRLFGQSPR